MTFSWQCPICGEKISSSLGEILEVRRHIHSLWHTNHSPDVLPLTPMDVSLLSGMRISLAGDYRTPEELAARYKPKAPH